METLIETLELWPRAIIEPKEVTGLLESDRKTIYAMLRRKNHPPFHRKGSRIIMCPRKLAEWFKKNEL
jgi:hypothetical protein